MVLGGGWVLDVAERRIGLLGATSLVGECLLPLLTQSDRQVVAFSRHCVARADMGVEWRQLDERALNPGASPDFRKIDLWICVAPIWVLPEHFGLLGAYGARRIVVLSSTSRFTKSDSSDPVEQSVARKLAEGEERLCAWAEANKVEWVILRPTLIYGRGRDKNISEIVRFIRRFGFFPLLGAAAGLRQPVHAGDVASACLAALDAPAAVNRAYNLSGGEVLSYREMVNRVFVTLGSRPRLLTVPLWIFRLAVVLMRVLPRYRHWTAAMAERMNQDMVFDHGEAAKDLGFSPRPFRLNREDCDN